jgi:hypothetical protein
VFSPRIGLTYNMMREMVFTALIISAVVGAARAQEGAAEIDPFHPSEVISALTATVPDNNSWGVDPFNNPLGGKDQIPKDQVPKDQAPKDQAQKEPESAPRNKGLTGIIFSNNMRLAIIDGNTLSVGSKMGGRKLVQIRTRSVVFEDASGGREEMFLKDFSAGK